ncbi:hypothetical protein MTR_5g060450 [Medicago truncatula]|uniref:Uncharacterized protein n=1 Tax=Medicago truncatula TaxID=3880 RepID=G7K9W8_MEDTR|nr:hypothetical protein MTR_5g060450 [Medicago truncatula]
MGRENLDYFHNQNLHINQRNTFLPMLCSRSIKDVCLPQCKDNLRSFSNDPLSPRIGCMGQVKKNNKISGFPSSHRISFITKTTVTATAAAPSTCGSRPRVSVNSGEVSRKYCNQKGHRNENIVPISIENMDPPLPVIKRVMKLEDENQVDSLWKRRSGEICFGICVESDVHVYVLY